MKTEVTVKCKIPSSEVIKRLKEKGWEYSSFYTMEDRYYSAKGERAKELSYFDLISSSFLTRIVRGEGEVDRQVIYKKKEFDAAGNIIGETKVKVYVEVEKLNEIFSLSGLLPWCTMVTKMTYFNKGNIELIVQEVEGLGTYIEIEEYEDIAFLTSDEKFNELVNLVKSLDIETCNNYSEKKIYSLLHKEK